MWIHNNTGNEYEIIEGLTDSKTIVKMDGIWYDCVIYASTSKDGLFVRRKEDFLEKFTNPSVNSEWFEEEDND